MRKLLAGLAVVGMLMVASPAQANGDYYQRSVTKAKPLSVTWDHTSAGIDVLLWWGQGSVPAHLDVTGPAECHVVVQPSEPYGECSLPVAPAGSYTATVSVDGGNVQQVTLAISD